MLLLFRIRHDNHSDNIRSLFMFRIDFHFNNSGILRIDDFPGKTTIKTILSFFS